MQLYAHDHSYLRTEYAREKEIESYKIEARERRTCKTCIHRLNNHDEDPCDSCHEQSEWKQDKERLHKTIPGTAPDTKAG